MESSPSKQEAVGPPSALGNSGKGYAEVGGASTWAFLLGPETSGNFFKKQIPIPDP